MMVNYQEFNYCRRCGKRQPKDIIFCPECRKKLRTKPKAKKKSAQKEWEKRPGLVKLREVE